jgi:phytoene/squalene synthetase
MNRIEFDVSETGLNAVLKHWQLKAMRVVWNSPEGANSRTVWMETNKALKTDTISRASVINFLEAMKEMRVLDADERTGKGGHHFVYKMGMDETAFKRFIASTLLDSLMRDFPAETKAALDKFGLE